MKNQFKKINILHVLISTTLIVLCATEFSHAAWSYYNGSISYVVEETVAQTITVDLVATPNSMTLPTNSTTLSWTTTGSPTSCVATTNGAWTGSKNPAGSSEVIGSLTAGNHLFEITCSKAGVSNATDTALVVVSAAPTPSGTLSASDCTISSGGSSCSSSVSWTTSNLTAAATSITRNTGSPASFTPSPLASGSQNVTLGYGTTTFSLIHNGATLATDPGVASCTSGTSWDGNSCEVAATPINGMCGAAHWNCIQGTSINQVTGMSSWMWTCAGINGGTNDSCVEPFGGGGGGEDPECSDGVDNDDPEDDLVDDQDPGCHTDGDANNIDSYDPADISENNRRKPIFIEF